MFLGTEDVNPSCQAPIISHSLKPSKGLRDSVDYPGRQVPRVVYTFPPPPPQQTTTEQTWYFARPPLHRLSLSSQILNVQRAESRKTKRKTRKRHDVAHAKHYVLRTHTHGRERQSARASTRGTTPQTQHTTHTQTRDMIQKGAALAGQPLFQALPPPSPTLRQMGSHRHMPRSPPSCSG